MPYVRRNIVARVIAIGDDLLASNDADKNVGLTTTYWKVKEFTIVADAYPVARMRIKFTLNDNGGSGVYGKIYRNGVAIGTERTIATAVDTEFTEDFNFSDLRIMDTIELWGKNASVVGSSGFVKNFRLCGVEAIFNNTVE